MRTKDLIAYLSKFNPDEDVVFEIVDDGVKQDASDCDATVFNRPVITVYAD